MSGSFDSGFVLNSFGEVVSPIDMRHPCNCGSRRVPSQTINESTGFDTIECTDCGITESTIGYDECIDLWNSVHTGAWE